MKIIVQVTLLVGVLARIALATYQLSQNYIGSTFFDDWDFYAAPDPTHGYVQYQTRKDAEIRGMIANRPGNSLRSPKQAYIGVDNTNVTPDGRPSVRIESKQSFYHGLFIADFSHMPGSICGVWPAFWLLGSGSPWPQTGEIDIIEGVNGQEKNVMTLHTTGGVRLDVESSPYLASFSGQIHTADCDVDAVNQPRNAGCSIRDESAFSYGDGFNAAGGGVYATQWTSESIRIWFFPRNKIPKDIQSGRPVPGSLWGKPSASFRGDFKVDTYFKAQKMIIDTTFCGDWAGSVWEYSTCATKARTCQEYVRDHPTAFEEAYWLINYIKVFQEDGPPSQPPSTSKPSIVGVSELTETRTTTITVTVTRVSTTLLSITKITSLRTSRSAVSIPTLRTRTIIKPSEMKPLKASKSFRASAGLSIGLSNNSRAPAQASGSMKLRTG